MSLHWEIPQGDHLHVAEEQSNHLKAEVTPPNTFCIFSLEVAAGTNLHEAPNPTAFAILPLGTSKSPNFLEGQKHLWNSSVSVEMLSD